MDVIKRTFDALPADMPAIFLSNAVDDHVMSRVMMLNWNAQENYFFHMTHTTTHKYAELKVNPHACITFYDPATRNQVICQCVVEIHEDLPTKQSCWNDKFRQFGYTGPEDTSAAVLVLRVSKVAEHFLGKQATITPVAPKAPATFALEKTAVRKSTAEADPARLMTLLRECYGKDIMTLLSTRDGVEVNARFMMMRFKEELGFYYLTYGSSGKVAELQQNPRVSIQWYFPAEGMKQVTAQAVAAVYKTPEQRRLVWGEDLRQFGFQGPDDQNLTVIRLEMKQVDVAAFGAPPVSLSAPCSYDAYQATLAEAFDKAPNFFMATHTPEGRIAGRMMMMRNLPAIGYHFYTFAPSAKIAQLQANDQMTLVWYTDKPSPLQVTIKAKAFVHVGDAALRQYVWNPALSQYGFQGPEDPNLTIIRFVPTEVTTQPFGQPEKVVYKRM